MANDSIPRHFCSQNSPLDVMLCVDLEEGVYLSFIFLYRPLSYFAEPFMYCNTYLNPSFISYECQY